MGFGWWLQHRGFRIGHGEFSRGLRDAGLVMGLCVGFGRGLQDAPLLAGLRKGFVGSSFDQSESALGAEPDVVRVFGSARCTKHRRSQPFRIGMVTQPCKAPAASKRTDDLCPNRSLSRSPRGLPGDTNNSVRHTWPPVQILRSGFRRIAVPNGKGRKCAVGQHVAQRPASGPLRFLPIRCFCRIARHSKDVDENRTPFGRLKVWL